MTNVKLRGIYSTALTGLLNADEWSVVQPSVPIMERFDQEFSFDEPTVVIEMTSDREGVLVTGEPEDVKAVSERLGGVGEDTGVWEATLPRGAVREGAVIETGSDGAILECSSGSMFLPFDRIDSFIEDGDSVIVQVHEPHPPWDTTLPAVDTRRMVFGGMLWLERAEGGTRADIASQTDADALVRETELLPVEVPDGWRVRWQPPALETSIEEKINAIEAACEKISVYNQEAPVTPEESRWVWFGRESRKELDTMRADWVPTMPGHHRIKTSSAEAGKAVDFVEQLETIPEEFPTEAVFGVFGPHVGDPYRIDHGKPNGTRFTLGEGTITEVTGESVTVRREMTAGGKYDGLGVQREEGDVADTTMTEGRWWYPTVYRSADASVKGMYVNICTPVELFPRRAVYMDLHVDVIRYPDGTTKRLDDDELAAAEDAGFVSEALAEKARSVTAAVMAGME